jgi:hypothetical protein
LTILTKTKEDHKEYQSKLHCIYVNCTSKALLLTLYNFSKSKVDNDNETNQTIQKETVDYSIEFYIEMNLLFSGFQGGDVIICSTTDPYLINNYTILS